MTTKTASRILLSMLILGPWALSGYFIIGGYVVYGVLLFVLGLVFLVWLWKPWLSRKHKHHSSDQARIG
jgi:membrane protein implicated in regulation of membrane protease activity